MNKQAANFVGSVPRNYDQLLGPRIFQGYAEDLSQRVACTHPQPCWSWRPLPAFQAAACATHLPASCDLLATDLNEPMLAIARQKFADGEPVRFQTADATRLSMTDASFEEVTCQFGVIFCPDTARLFSEFTRELVFGDRMEKEILNLHERPVIKAWQGCPLVRMRYFNGNFAPRAARL